MQNVPTTRDEALLALERSLDSDFLKALGEPVRVSILKILIAQGDLDVGRIAEQLPQERSVISRHVKVLQGAGLVSIRREGRHRICALVPAAFVGRLEQILTSTRAAIDLCCKPAQA